MEINTPQFWLAALQIIYINILLSGDNAVVIALACRDLPPRQRRWGVIWGAAGAIVLRIVLTIFAVTLLTLPWLKVVGGVLLLWIGIKLIVEDDDGEHSIKASDRLWSAVRTVIVADLVMSVDNVLGVAAAAKGSVPLLVFGLVVSIPLVIAGSQVILKLIERFPLIILAGGGLLGWIAGKMLVEDVALMPWIEAQAPWLEWVGPVAGVVVVLGVAQWMNRRAVAAAR
ncbi:MAG TPA: TerC family protein [Casimicrobiaceae bacterium]|nr:TerC family protein [Casimicrobiaceae bacterium]